MYAGILRYPSSYAPMVRPPYPPRPGAVAVMPPLSRPPIGGLRAPLIPLVIRAATPVVIPAEKPQTTVFVGKIASAVENNFMLALLQVGYIVYHDLYFCFSTSKKVKFIDK